MIGITISSIIIGITIYKTFKIVEKNEIKNYKEFLDYFIKNEKNLLTKNMRSAILGTRMLALH